MGEAIGDERVAAVLRRFVAGCAPVLGRLRDGDEPVDLDVAGDDGEIDHGVLARVRARLEQVRWPGSARWSRLDVDERTHWWVSRVGRVTALAASVTGLAGALGDRLPLQDVLGSAGQGLLLCAIATEHGVVDRGAQVRLLASVLFDRELDPVVAAGPGGAAGDAADAAEVARLTGAESAAESARSAERVSSGRLGLKQAARWLWRQGRMLFAVYEELEKRPHGRFYHQALGMLPVVGLAGDYLGERSALKRAARAGKRWLRAHPELVAR
ncbi:hypothetical protein [Actinophytocola gossypii]|uniref:Phytoene synthase n=1 Tax=Actinophytocola gossypii TaxID=2812003 RepID=A0ABT2J1A6_9PSEU|nr:hypothetical protein [Actinophytocola gossypii]MCT2581642.1 hypothetical protein [Actinophytocola gossypii]